MSKQNSSGRWRRGLRVALGLWLAGAGLAGGAWAQLPARPPQVVNPRSASIAAATADVLRETSEIRKLAVLHPVRSGAQTRADIERMLIQNLDAEAGPAELRAAELTLKRLGLAPADFQLRSFMISLLVEQVMGYYDPKTQIFYLADWVDLDTQQSVMAHELTHALQDQHFNLRRFDKWPKGDGDAELAAHALVEGDAMLAMTFYIMRSQARVLAAFRAAGLGAAATTEIDRAPRVLRESLLFPYQQGLAWVQQLYKRGGWAQVSRAYTELPQSSEQVLHPDKYFAHEAPVKVVMPDIAAHLGAGWRRLEVDVNGEWGYYQLLAEYIGAADAAERAAAGWGGDRFALYEQAQTGATCIAQTTVWDSVADAQEFFAAYAQRTERRYQVAAPDAQLSGRTAARSVWRTDSGLVVMQRQGARVVILEGLPAQVPVDKLLQLLLRT